MKKVGLWLVALLVIVNTGFSGVMMQGFYWDVPAGGNWWNTMKNNAYSLRYMASGYGINRIWFPPASKCLNGGYSMGYDPYDYYDLGYYSQMGTVETRFGSQAELKAAIAKFKSYGVSCTADIVLNHRAGGASEANPKTGGSTWTSFAGVKSGKAKWHWDSFHPNNYCGGDEGSFGGYPDVCYAAGMAYTDMKAWMNWLKSTVNAGFDSWRFDYVKGVPAWAVKDMRAATGNPFSVGEYWDANTSTLDWWAGASTAQVFDFALYYTMKDICNNTGGGGYLPNVFDYSKSYAAKNYGKAVTFVGNHDTDEIYSDKMMAYAFILTYKGYPCIFWKDYYNYGLAAGGGSGTGWGNGIKQLVWCREKLAKGSPNISILKSSDGDWIAYQSSGYSTTQPGYIVIINDNSSAWKGGSVTTSNAYLKGKTLKAYAWSSSKSGQNYAPANQACSSTGVVQVWAAPRGYAVYSVNGL
ncbi:MAG: alpha-amylase [Spirochaetes bacterium GWF1_51_8]|nr:MAG: alpha-amylase [Spirochaetes bacterium GWF1_51_8]